MATDSSLWLHGTSGAGTTIPGATGGTANFYTSVDLGSNTINRVFVAERRVGATQSGTGFLDIFFQDSTDNTTFTNMPAATGALLGFPRTSNSDYTSTDSVNAGAPARIVLRTDKRYIRIGATVSTSSTTFPKVSVILKPVEGANTGYVGHLDV